MKSTISFNIMFTATGLKPLKVYKKQSYFKRVVWPFIKSTNNFFQAILLTRSKIPAIAGTCSN